MISVKFQNRHCLKQRDLRFATCWKWVSFLKDDTLQDVVKYVKKHRDKVLEVWPLRADGEYAYDPDTFIELVESERLKDE